MNTSSSQSAFPSQTPVPVLARTLTELDYVRINNLVRRLPVSNAGVPSVNAVMDFADIVPSREIAPNVVTMYTRVRVSDPGTQHQPQTERELTLVYPQDANADTGFVSVLSPVGSALLGVAQGNTAIWNTPDGRIESAQVREILFQPEASGDFTK